MSNILLKNSNDKEAKSNFYNYLVENLLLRVKKPAQYLGNERGHLIFRDENQGDSTLKSWKSTKVRTAIIYPDLYELGMANFGIKILYKIINSFNDYLCDRAYAPMQDMEEILRSENIPLWGIETCKPLNEFDLLGVSLSYELSYTNVLNVLELSHLNLFSKDRTEIFPLVFGGGPATFNPEPMADFFDFYIIGDGEEVLVEICNLINSFKSHLSNESNTLENKTLKENLLLQLASIEGVYVPRFYTPDEHDNYIPKKIRNDVPDTIQKRVVSISDFNHPMGELVPYLSTVHDRQVLEIRRGCDRGCRFCQPGYVYLPVRERTPENLLDISKKSLENTGYDEYSLLSLSASDYTKLHEVAFMLNSEHKSKGISLSMPSQRADRFDIEIANELNVVRNSGITLAPEAGTERLREVINKGLKEDDIKKAIENVYDSGYKHVKLYFMIGLPTETFEDLDGIVNLLLWMKYLSKTKNKKPLDVTCTISTFVPKSFTPFQWVEQNSTELFLEKIKYLKEKIRKYKLYNVKLNCTDPNIALLEVVLSRGDRRVGKLIHTAFQDGAKFDAWGESLDLSRWINASQKINLDLNEFVKKKIVGSNQPWEIIDSGLLKKFLIEEINKAFEVKETAACTENTCHACGVCFDLNVLNEVSVNLSKGNKFVKEIQDKNDVNSNESKNFNSSIDFLSLPSMEKKEIIHTKLGEMSFLGHLDLQKLFDRALRRAKIPVAFTQGFNPRPKFQWTMPLPIFYESEHEVLHLELSSVQINNDLLVALNKELPPEVQIKSIKSMKLTDKLPNFENLQFSYKILTCNHDLWEKYICELQTNVERFLSSDSHKIRIFKINKNEKYSETKVLKELDIRKSVNSIEILSLKPIELKIILTGNTRVENVLNEIFPNKFYINPEELKDKWQLFWKIKKVMVIN